MKMAQTMQRNTTENPKEAVNNVEQCTNPTYIQHIGRAKQIMSDLITSKEFSKAL